ncbi:MAG: FAD binding domain-containing protein [Dorea sp.]|nr:FAD binding domain-containing protein [Dorea sp.]
MIKIKEYVKATSLEEAYQLNQKRGARVIGGMLWMKMMKTNVTTAIDLSGLGLDQIEETEEEYRIGCMTSLRALELHEGLCKLSQGMIPASVEHIVGVQFRNLATVGGSIFGRFGFSDVMTCFLALDSYVELYKGGIVPMTEFVKMKKDKDILVRVIVKKQEMKGAYLSQRITKTDFPTLTVAVAAFNDQVRVVVGARPGIAMVIPVSDQMKERILSGDYCENCAKSFAEELSAQVKMDSNIKGSAEYRTHLSRVLIRRGLMQMK